ncbi:Proteasome subunit beta type [Rhodotorula toruloides ATCC 204091]|uniref:Proteasome subunit beta type n=1 Tax=Rhodotorula toruloides TaxID=5286 RepID=A0A2T0AA18_RHOTO|nr:Proteasome subunit beta type [Rhodotorula toruloides ATCC 204091]PRQ74861.1 proteasome subunit beta type [Rhodotorula toruloides]
MQHPSQATTLTPDVSRLKAGEMNLGTSIMAVAFEGGVVVGADSRTTMGSFIANRAVADVVTAQLSQYEMTHGEKPTVHIAATMLEGIIYQNKDRLSAGIIVAGWDRIAGGTVYNIPLGGGLFSAPWCIAGSGSTFVWGYCDKTFEPGWNKDQTLEFVRDTLSLAMSRDGSSGGTIRMAIITEEGVERVFVPGDKLPNYGGDRV